MHNKIINPYVRHKYLLSIYMIELAGIQIMKLSVKKFYLLSILFICIFTAYIPIAFGAPSIKPDAFSHKVGEIIEGEELINEFRISNVGDQTLIIEKIDAG